MCEANETLQKAAFELDIMLGNQRVDFGRLKQLLNQACEHGDNR
jgi:hypothetical protein